MSTIAPPQNPEADPRVKAVFDDIRATRQTDFINNMWRYLAFDPALLEQTWAEVKRVMATPSTLDPLTKELVYLAVSISNGCDYCIASHGASARKKGMTTAMLGELIAVVGMANETNRLANGLRFPVDEAFRR